jgi:hypothetical protein
MRDIYRRLGIGGFDQAEGKMRDFLAERSEHQVSRYEMPLQLKRKVVERLAPYIDRFGYREKVEKALAGEPKPAIPARQPS